MGARAVLLGTCVALVLLVAGGASPSGAATTAEKPRLKSMGSCGALARFARRHSTAVIVREEAERKRAPNDVRFDDPLSGEPSTAPGEGGGAAQGGAAEEFSRTNVQEEGIDEPDIVKTNGSHVFVAGGNDGNQVHALDARAERPRTVGSVKLPGNGAQLLLAGDRIIAISYDFPADDDHHYDDAETTVVSEIDVSDPAGMRVLRTEEVEGEYVDARLHGDVVRLAIHTPPRAIVVEQPEDEEWDAAERRAARRRAVRLAPVRTWRPNATVTNRVTGERYTRGAVPCGSIRRPREYSGLGLLSVLTIDAKAGLPSVDADGVFAAGDTLYAARGGLYVATEEWIDRDSDFEGLPGESVTAIHKFALDGARTTYAASGAVPGYMLSQWAMSEHDGHLRTATTNEPPWLEDDVPARESDSQVIVLAERDGALVEVGRAGGLGRGESIYAVRFMGERGFVVTFEEIDPLYTLDLSVPERPRVAGELKIPGYSAYLHPVGEGLLLGVGQSVERRQLSGLQLSLFDVSDLAAPRRVAVRTVTGEAYSEAEWDHHAFLYWPATGLTVLPLELYASDGAETQDFSGAIGFRVDAARRTIADAGRLSSPPEQADYDWTPPPSRNVVIGQRLFSIWPHGVRVSRLDDLSQGEWVRVPDSA